MKTPLFFTLCLSLPLLPQPARAVEAPQIIAGEEKEATEPLDPAYAKAEENCIGNTETSLKTRGLLPSEESNEYDAQFEALFAACMQNSGFTQSLLDAPEEALPPEDSER